MKRLVLLIILLSTTWGSSLSATTISEVQQQLLAEINSAQKRHQQAISNIAQERRKLLAELSKQEALSNKLSKKAQAITRNKDEQSLSLDNLEQRLTQWQQQLNYLHHLLDGMATDSTIRSAAQLGQWLSAQQQTSFNQAKVALTNGSFAKGQYLSIGPLNWFISDDQRHAGFIQREQQQWLLAYPFDSQQTEQLADLLQQGQGHLPVDPSNNRSITLAQHQESVSEHLTKGGIWVFPILAFALMALVIACGKALALFRLPKLHTAFVTEKNLGHHQQALLALTKRYQGQQLDDLLFDQLNSSRRSIERGLSAIAVTASVAPLLGLLGTVSGMIQTFKLMTLFGSGDASAVSGGISESLVTTELGLIVAIPALVAHALMSRKCQHYMAGLESFAIKLSHQQSEQHQEVTANAN